MSARLNRKELRRGYHFCPDWDGLLISRGCSEYLFCGCPDHRRKPRIRLKHPNVDQITF